MRAAAGPAVLDRGVTNPVARRTHEHRTQAPRSRQQARALARGRRRKAHCQTTRPGQVQRPRTDREDPRRGQLCRARRLRHPPLHRFRDGRRSPAHRWRDHRPRHDRRPAGLHLLAGFHDLGRFAVQGLCRENLQDHGSRRDRGRTDHRPQRFGRRADPGGRRRPRRVRRHLPQERPRLGPGAADLAHSRALRRRRRLLAGDHRFRHDGPRHLVHVSHRAQGGQAGHPRRRHHRSARRRRCPRQPERGRPSRRRHRGRGLRNPPLALRLSAPEPPREDPHRPDRRSAGSGGSGAQLHPPRQRQPALRCARGHHARGRRRRVPRDPAGFRTQPRRRLCPFQRTIHRHRRQPAAGDGRGARQQRLDQGGAFRALLRLVLRSRS